MEKCKLKDLQNGITLISLIITIILLLILAGVVLSLAIGEDGIFNIAENASKKYSEAEAREKLESVLLNLQMDKQIDSYYNESSYIDNKIIQAQMKISGNIVTVNGWKFEIDRTVPEIKRTVKLEEEVEEDRSAETLVLLDHFDNKYENINKNYITTDNKKIGNGALILNTTNIVDTNNSYFNFTQDFTIDYWIYSSSANLQKAWAPHIVAKTNDGIWIGFNNKKFVVRGYNNRNFIEIEPPQADEWVHIAITRKDGIIYVFYNGILQGQVQKTSDFKGAELSIGTDGGTNYTIGYIDELRIINGKADWTSNFTVPQNEYTNIDGILYHFDYNEEVLYDNTKLDKTEKKFGTASKYFNNANVMYEAKSEFGFTQDFTIDYWVKMTSDNLQKAVMPHITVKTYNGMWLGINNGKFVVRGYNNTNFIEIEPPQPDEWIHIAITRKDGIIYVFYNGILQGQVENKTEFNQGQLYIGTDGGGKNYITGYMDELRILNGWCQWDKNFTPPDKEYKY